MPLSGLEGHTSALPQATTMRAPTTAEVLKAAPFAQGLCEAHLQRLEHELVLREVPAGASVCQKSRKAEHWVGVARGTIKIHVLSPDGRGTTLATFSDGCWFGEGTLLKGEPWPFDAAAIGNTLVALVPAATFQWLLDNSFPFNRFLIDQLNARLGQFISRCEHARLHQSNQHVAHCIAELIDSRLYPFVENRRLTMSQEELASLAGVSRQIVNRALGELEDIGVVRVAYGSLTLIDPEGLRRFSESFQ